MMPIIVSNLNDITFDINGAVLASKRWENWPYSSEENKSNYLDFWTIQDSNGLTFKSSEKSGKIDG